MLFPNPVSDYLNLETGEAVNSSDLPICEIYKLNGTSVIKPIVSNRVYVGDLLSGIYVLKLKSKHQTLVYKFVKR